jgi:hypothetical protein
MMVTANRRSRLALELRNLRTPPPGAKHAWSTGHQECPLDLAVGIVTV